MALTKAHMKTIILRNGHLGLEGDESIDELRTALMYLRQHTYQKCVYPGMGTPIEALIPDISVLTAKSTRSRNVKNVVTKRERL